MEPNDIRRQICQERAIGASSSRPISAVNYVQAGTVLTG
jgi:hypothetical protein